MLSTILDISREANDSLLIEGPHGLGKSQQVKEWCTDNNFNLETLFTSLIEESDLTGIPVPSEDKTSTIWLKPQWAHNMDLNSFPSTEFKNLSFEDKEFEIYLNKSYRPDTIVTISSIKHELNSFYNSDYTEFEIVAGIKDKRIYNSKSKHSVLFLDELNRSTLQVLNSALELVLNKTLNDNKLPVVNGVLTYLVAAINPADLDYNVTEFDPALLDRFMKYNMTSDAESWLVWASKNDIHTSIRRFIAKKPEYIHVMSDTEPMSPTPRSWAKLSDSIKVMEVKGINPDTFYDVVYSVIKGKIGKLVGIEYLNFYTEFSKVLDIEDIEESAEKAFKKNESLDDSVQVVKELIESQESITLSDIGNDMIKIFNKKGYSPELEDNIGIVAYLNAIPLEIATAVLQDLQKSDFSSYRNIAKIDRTIFNRILAVADSGK